MKGLEEGRKRKQCVHTVKKQYIVTEPQYLSTGRMGERAASPD